MELDKIPGYKEAIAQAAFEEEALRDAAFLGFPEDICGLEVKPFTPRHMLLLNAAGSPFLNGGQLNAGDVGIFLWIVSPRFKPFDKKARERFFKEISAINSDWETGINDYLDRAFFDEPPAKGNKREPIVSVGAVIVHRMAISYGWGLNAILDEPFSVLYQLFRMLELEANPKAVFFNRKSDQVRRRFVREWMKNNQDG